MWKGTASRSLRSRGPTPGPRSFPVLLARAGSKLASLPRRPGSEPQEARPAGAGKAEEKESSSLFIFKASSIWRMYLLFSFGSRGERAHSNGNWRSPIYCFSSGLSGPMCLVVSFSFLSLSHPGPQLHPALRTSSLRDLGKLSSRGQCQALPIRGSSDYP